MKILRDPVIVCVVVFLAISGLGQNQNQKLTAEEIVARHLESIGTASARAAVKSRTVQAKTIMDMIVGPSAHAEGTSMLVSLQRQLSMSMRFLDGRYPDEQFLFDGKEAKIGLTGPNTRSRLGDWLYREDAVVRESLLGGTLLTSWALLDVRGRQAKLRYEGLKRINDRELHDILYSPKKGADNDLKIHLYFEPDTFRHVRTVYTFLVSAPMAHTATQRRGPIRAQNSVDSRYTIEETFGDFRTLDGITLPGHWKLQYTAEADQTISAAFDFTAGGITHNNVVD